MTIYSIVCTVIFFSVLAFLFGVIIYVGYGEFGLTKEQHIQRTNLAITINDPYKMPVSQIYDLVKNWDTVVGTPIMSSFCRYRSKLPYEIGTRYDAICYGPVFIKPKLLASPGVTIMPYVVLYKSDDLSRIYIEAYDKYDEIVIKHHIKLYPGMKCYRVAKKGGSYDLPLLILDKYWGDTDIVAFKNEFADRIRTLVNSGYRSY